MLAKTPSPGPAQMRGVYPRKSKAPHVRGLGVRYARIPGDHRTGLTEPMRTDSGALPVRVGSRGVRQNAGTTAPLYWVWMKRLTCSVCSAAASFFTAAAFWLSARVTSQLA